MELALEQAPVVVLAALVGWCLGFASAWATDWLQVQDELPSAARGPLIRDLALQACCALVWAAAVLLLEGPWWRWVALGIIAVPLLQVAMTDLRHRYLYTAIAVVGVALGLGLGWLVHGYAWWWGAVGAAGAGVGFLIVYWLGLLIARLMHLDVEPMARGDIQIAAMVGAAAGTCTASAVFLGVVLNGVYALLVVAAALLTRRRWRLATMPYGPALCMAGVVALFAC